MTKERREMIKGQEYPNGMTIKELKDIIKDWPETNINGEPTEVWVETGSSVSSPVVEIRPLNNRTQNEVAWADILFKSNAFKVVW